MIENKNGCLYLVATPIGNLEDMTYRGVRILNEVDLIAAEDTRNTRKLLSHYDIHTALTSYHEHNKFEKGPQLITKLQEGLDIAVVSDAGLICSGIDTRKFTFIGFLPKTSKKRKELLESIKLREETLIFYETPYHLKDMLKELMNILGKDRQASTCRELTKKFEEFNRGTLEELVNYFHENEPRGEFVVIVSGITEEMLNEQEDTKEDISPVKYVQDLMEKGINKKEAMRTAAKALNMSRRDIYQALLKDD